LTCRIVWLALALLAVPVGAQAPAPAIEVPFCQFRLANGLNVILHQDRSVPVVAVNVWYQVGSANEKPGRTGLAHLFEHLMFEGSKHVAGGEFDTLLEAAGATSNGSTNKDRTNYIIDLPSNALELALFLESDRMGYLLDTMSPARVDGQRDVVKNERRQNYENRPYGMASIELDKLLWPATHPYSWPTIGSMEDLSAASYEDVVDFFKKYYAPNNASLVIAGDIDLDRTRALVEKWFGDIPRGPDVEPLTAPPAVLTEVRRATLTDRVALPRLYLGWLTPPLYAPGDAALDVVASILAGGKSSRLYRRLVYEAQIAQDVAMLDEGAGSRSALEIADAIDFLGAELSTSSSFDASAVRLNVPVTRLAEALPIVADVVLRPTFPQPEPDRLRQERLTALLQARDDPVSVSTLAFSRTVYGPAHRYGTSPLGTEATLKAFTVGDLRSFHEAWYQPAHATIIVAGDITMDAMLPLAEQHFGAWRAGRPLTRQPVPHAPQPDPQITIVDLPGAEQSFTSRLNQNLREKHGYAYGAGSGFDMRRSAGPFSARASVQTDKTAEALKEFYNELTAMSQPIPAAEIARAKNYIALGFPSEFETIGDLSARLEELVVYRLPDDYFERYVSNIQAVTAAAVQKAAATYIQPRRFAVVIVGDRAAIEPGIRALKLGSVRVLTVDQAIG
jgi:predicted Zn-dependent peptidase